MKKEIAEIIEKEHNVTIDLTADMYTTGDIDDDYGWMPVPQEWVEQALEYLAYN